MVNGQNTLILFPVCVLVGFISIGFGYHLRLYSSCPGQRQIVGLELENVVEKKPIVNSSD